MLRLFILAVFIFWSIPASATNFFVNQSGSGSGNGSSLANAMSIANYNAGNLNASTNPGDTIYFCDAITTNINSTEGGESENNLILCGDCSTQGGVDLSTNKTVYADQNYLTIDHFTVTGITGSGNWHGSIRIEGDNVTVQNCLIYNNTVAGIRTESYASNAIIQDNVVHTCTSYLFYLPGDGHIIRRNEGYNPQNYVNGVTLESGQSDYCVVCGNNHTYSENYFHSYSYANQTYDPEPPHADAFQGYSGGACSAASNILIEHNWIDMQVAPVHAGTSTHIVMVENGCHDWTLTGNIFLIASGVNTGSGSPDNYNMYFYNNLWVGDLSYTTYTCYGIQLIYCDNCKAYNNITVDFDGDHYHITGEAASPLYDYNLMWDSDSGTPDLTGYTPQAHDQRGVDPKFVDFGGEDFTLQLGSTAIDAGTTPLGELINPNSSWPDSVDTISGDEIGPFVFGVGITAALTGTLADGATEAQIVAGGETLIITLSEDTWVATFGDDNQITTDFIAGLDSGGAEAHGWDVEVKGNMVHGDVARTNDTTATVTLGAEASYAITGNETITCTIPASSLTESDDPVVATPTFEITADLIPIATITGTLADNALETEIVSGGETLIVTLTNDTWVATMGDDNEITTAFIAGLDSAQSEAAGWDAVVKANMVYTDVTRDSDTQVTVLLGAEPTYDISANESITVVIPASALTSGIELTPVPSQFSVVFFTTETEKVQGLTLQ